MKTEICQGKTKIKLTRKKSSPLIAQCVLKKTISLKYPNLMEYILSRQNDFIYQCIGTKNNSVDESFNESKVHYNTRFSCID